MTKNAVFEFNDDRPKQDPRKEDRLGYASFAAHVAKVIINLDPSNGYVIGLHSRWGAGKSTAMNFILAYLDEHNRGSNKNRIIHIDFRPWIVSGHQDVVAAFFKVLSETLDSRKGRLRRFVGCVVSPAARAMTSLVEAAVKISILTDPTIGSIGSRFAGEFAKVSIKELVLRSMEEPSLQKTYEQLSDKLKTCGKRFIVTIDDIDRLSDADVRTIMQMAKSIGQLPNIVYLLAYDRRIVWKALGTDEGAIEPGFAEKIVQHEIDLPRPSKTSLLSILYQELPFLENEGNSSSRWDVIERDGTERWIRSPRDVVRLSNAVKFCWSALGGEVDSVDLLVMEGLRLFDNGTFVWIRDNHDFLIGVGRFAFTDDGADDGARKEVVDSLKRILPAMHQPRIMTIVSVLFPQCEKWLDVNVFPWPETLQEVANRQGVGCRAGYDAYFGFRPNSGEEWLSDADDSPSPTPDVDEPLRAYFEGRNRKSGPLADTLRKELERHSGGKDVEGALRALLGDVFRVGEERMKVEAPSSRGVPSPGALAAGVVIAMARRLEWPNAGRHLVEAFGKSLSPGFSAGVFVELGRRKRVFPGDAVEGEFIDERDLGRGVVGDGDFEEMGSILVARMMKARDDGTLSSAPCLCDIVNSWGRLGDRNDARAWVNEGVRGDAEFLLKVCRCLVEQKGGMDKPRFVMKVAPDERLYDLAAIAHAAREHDRSARPTDEERALLRAVFWGAEEILGRRGQSARPNEVNDGDR